MMVFGSWSFKASIFLLFTFFFLLRTLKNCDDYSLGLFTSFNFGFLYCVGRSIGLGGVFLNG